MNAMRTRNDEGSAVVEFVGVATVLCLVVLSVLQLILALHVRNTLVDCAAEGARHAALAGKSPQDGVERTRDLISSAISPHFAEQISATVTTVDGAQVVDVQVQAPLPVLGLLGLQQLTVHGHGVLDQP